MGEIEFSKVKKQMLKNRNFFTDIINHTDNNRYIEDFFIRWCNQWQIDKSFNCGTCLFNKGQYYAWKCRDDVKKTYFKNIIELLDYIKLRAI